MNDKKPSCEGNHCPSCGADPPERPYCSIVCKEPIFHIWERIHDLEAKLAKAEEEIRTLQIGPGPSDR